MKCLDEVGCGNRVGIGCRGVGAGLAHPTPSNPPTIYGHLIVLLGPKVDGLVPPEQRGTEGREGFSVGWLLAVPQREEDHPEDWRQASTVPDNSLNTPKPLSPPPPPQVQYHSLFSLSLFLHPSLPPFFTCTHNYPKCCSGPSLMPSDTGQVAKPEGVTPVTSLSWH